MLAWTPFNVRRLRPVSMLLLGIACLGSTSVVRLRADEPPTDRQPSVDSSATDKVQLENATEPESAASELMHAPQKPDGLKAKRRGNAGRLPPHFASIVDSRQRQAIYEIRTRVASELEQLEKQLDALRHSEMAEIEGVLTADQRTQLESLRAQRAQSAKAKGVEPAVR